MLEIVKPMDIEKRSFEIITELLGDTPIAPENELVVKRVIHTSADFDYAKNLAFSEGAEGRLRHCHRYPDGKGGHQQNHSGKAGRAGSLLHVR